MLLEADLIVKRATLRWLAQRHPQWTHQELATALQMSRSWESRVAAPPAPGRSSGCHGPARPNACTPHAACFSCITTGRRPTHPRDPHCTAREPAARPWTRGHPVLFAARSSTQAGRRAPAALSLRRSGRSCARRAVLKRIVAVSRSRWNCGSQGRKFSSISKMPVVYPLIQTASDSTWWRSPTLWMRAPRCGCIGRSGRTSTPKPYWKSSPSFSVSGVCLPCSPSIMIPALWGAHPGAISRSRVGALLVVPWGETQRDPATSSR
jgi:hypothetical protein